MWLVLSFSLGHRVTREEVAEQLEDMMPKPLVKKPTYRFIDDEAECSDASSDGDSEDQGKDVTGLIDDQWV